MGFSQFDFILKLGKKLGKESMPVTKVSTRED